MPLVSVIIPTKNRPRLLHRAIISVLAQRFQDFEVLVVIDGVDPQTRECLTGVMSAKIRVIALEESVGGAEARNIGVRSAAGDFVAFLDDDDEWLEDKLECQASLIGTSQNAIVCSQVLARFRDASYVWPYQKPYRPIAEYLIERRGLGFGNGLLHTSTILTSKMLAERMPFTLGLKKHQDWDWLIRVMADADTRLLWINRPLAVWHQEDTIGRVSHTSDWRTSLAWIKSVQTLVTHDATSHFIALYVAPAVTGVLNYPEVIRAFCSDGCPSSDIWFKFIAGLVTPRFVRRFLRSLHHTNRLNVSSGKHESE